MKKTLYQAALLAALALSLASCSDRLDLEDATIPLAIGLDLDGNGELLVYTTSPVFMKDSKNKTLETAVKGLSPRQSRAAQGAEATGVLEGKNFQAILIGGRLAQHEGWFRLLDVLFRDARNTTTDRMIYYQGSLKDVIYNNSPDQPILPIVLKGMVDSKSLLSETVLTTVQELHRQVNEKGETPAVSEIDLQNGRIALKGTALLDNGGVYAMSLDKQETALLRILQKKAKTGISLSYPLPDKPRTGPFRTNMISFSLNGIKTKIRTSYAGDRFRFDLKVTLPAGLSEVLFPHNTRMEAKELEQQISRLVEAQCEDLIERFQKRRIDPIGLGVYARAYEYEQFKKVQEKWPDAFARAKINVKVEVSIKASGPVM